MIFCSKIFCVFRNNAYLCIVNMIIHLNTMLMKKKNLENCVKSSKMLGNVEHFIYFCR